MKFLYKFNEMIDWRTVTHDMESFCKSYLADILDTGSNLTITNLSINTLKDLEMYKDNTHKFHLFLGVGDKMPTWGDIKDTFIPFLDMFVRSYGDVDVTLKGHTSILSYTFGSKSIIDENIDITDKTLIRIIEFTFKYKEI